MSIEKTFERIAVALEALANLGSQKLAVAVSAPIQQVIAPVAAAPAPAAPPAAPPAAAAHPVIESATAAAHPVIESATAAAHPVTVVDAPLMTVQELNDALVVEFLRLGSKREPIDKAMAEFGVTSVNNLDVSQYAPLLAAVKAISV